MRQMCENCGSEHDGSYASGRFCSKKCGFSFSTKFKRKEINEKVSNTIQSKISAGEIFTRPLLTVLCENCKTSFFTKRAKRFCSNRCSRIYVSNLESTKEKVSKHFSEIAKKRYEAGDSTIGWKTRSLMKPSYPELVTMQFFDKLSLSYEREKKVGKYFIDFAIGNIAIEIDGVQHEREDRKIHDEVRDEFLESQGWKIYRVKWKNDNMHSKKLEELLKKLSII